MRFEYAAFNDLRVTITLTVSELRLLERLVCTVNHGTKEYAKAFRDAATAEYNSFYETELHEVDASLRETKTALYRAMRGSAEYNDAVDNLVDNLE